MIVDSGIPNRLNMCEPLRCSSGSLLLRGGGEGLELLKYLLSAVVSIVNGVIGSLIAAHVDRCIQRRKGKKSPTNQ